MKTDNCHEDTTCLNTYGKFQCSCNNGFLGNGISCIDLGECIVTKPCHRNVQCKNTIGSYNCSCDKGYHGDGTGRYDINECGLKIHNCHEHAS